MVCWYRGLSTQRQQACTRGDHGFFSRAFGWRASGFSSRGRPGCCFRRSQTPSDRNIGLPVRRCAASCGLQHPLRLPRTSLPSQRLAACSITGGCLPARVPHRAVFPTTQRGSLTEPRCVLRGSSLFLGQARAATWKQPLGFMGASARRSQLPAHAGTGQTLLPLPASSTLWK